MADCCQIIIMWLQMLFTVVTLTTVSAAFSDSEIVVMCTCLSIAWPTAADTSVSFSELLQQPVDATFRLSFGWKFRKQPASIMDSSGDVFHKFPALSALFGSDIPESGILGNMAYAWPVDACGPVEPVPRHLGNRTQWIALIRRNLCSFVQKVQNVQHAGFVAAVIHNVHSDSLLRMHGATSSVTIPSVFIGAASAEVLSKYNYSINYIIELKLVDSGYKFLWPFVAVLIICMCVMVTFTVLKYACGKIHTYITHVTKSNLRKLPVKKFSRGDTYDMCAICLEEYQVGDKLRIMPCSHAFHRKCIDPWLTKTKHTCPLCKKKVFHHMSADDSDSDSASVENSGTNASERTPLLASGAVLAATAASVHETPADATVTTVVVINVEVMSTAVSSEPHCDQSCVEIHRAEFHDATSPDQHATGSALPMDASGPLAADLSASCSITRSSHVSSSQHITA